MRHQTTRFSVVVASVVLLSFAACGQNPTGGLVGVSSSVSAAIDNKSVVTRYYEEVWNQGNLFVLQSIGDPCLQDHVCLAAQGPGLAGLESIIRSVQETYVNSHFQIEDLIAENDLVVARWNYTANFGPTNYPVSIRGHETWRVTNGLLSERWGTVDFLSLMSQTFANAAPIPDLPVDATGYQPTASDVQAVQMYYDDIFNNGSSDLIDTVFAEDFVDHSPDAGQTPDRDGFKASLDGFLNGFSNASLDVESLTVQGDKVWVDWVCNALFPGTNVPVSFGGREAWHARDGEIKERWGEYDLEALVDQVGFVATPQQPRPGIINSSGPPGPCAAIEPSGPSGPSGVSGATGARASRETQ